MAAPVKTRPADFLPLSTANFHILLALADGERHGYAIMQEVAEATARAVRLGPGTLYRCLQALLEESFIEESARQSDDPRRRYYRLTSLGRRVLSAEVRRLEDVVALARRRKLGYSG